MHISPWKQLFFRPPTPTPTLSPFEQNHTFFSLIPQREEPILTWATQVRKKSRSLSTVGKEGMKRKLFSDSKRYRRAAIFARQCKKTKQKLAVIL